jgi:hypothetical protein
MTRRSCCTLNMLNKNTRQPLLDRVSRLEFYGRLRSVLEYYLDNLCTVLYLHMRCPVSNIFALFIIYIPTGKCWPLIAFQMSASTSSLSYTKDRYVIIICRVRLGACPCMYWYPTVDSLRHWKISSIACECSSWSGVLFYRPDLSRGRSR